MVGGAAGGTAAAGAVTDNGTDDVVKVTVETQPAGLQLMIDGVTFNAPKVYQWFPGSTHAAVAPGQASADGKAYYAFDRRSDGFAHCPLAGRDRPETHLDPEQVQKNSLDGALPLMVRSRHHRHRREQPRSEAATRHIGGKLRCGTVTARALERVAPVLGDMRFDLWGLRHLMPHRIPNLFISGGVEFPCAPVTLGRIVVLDLADQLGRDHLPVVPLVPRLPALLPARRLLLGRALDPRRIAGRRLGGVVGVLGKPGFELPDAFFENPVSFFKGDQPLDEGGDSGLGFVEGLGVGVDSVHVCFMPHPENSSSYLLYTLAALEAS